MTTQHDRKPYLLIILDGWGYREESSANAIRAASTPCWDRLWNERPHTLITASGTQVGLPAGQMGNSEVGHMNLGAGRIVHQDLTRISKLVTSGEFYRNPALREGVQRANAAGGVIHIFGLLSPGGVHSHEDHIRAAVDLCIQNNARAVYVHAFLDGRDVPPRSARDSLVSMDAHLRATGKGRIATIMGRFYAMDRDNRWDRIERAYSLLTTGSGEFSHSSVEEALDAAYQRDENDEFVIPTSITDIADEDSSPFIHDGDTVIFMNFRADRAREITRAFTDDNFDHFQRSKAPLLADYVTLTKYADDIHTSVAYGPADLTMVFGETIANLNLTQLRIAETEKYAHVTFFFSGGREEPFAGEERILIPSPPVRTYDLQPEMSAREVTDELVQAIRSGSFDAIICNFANGDMVGHTGVMDASIKAVETLDDCLSKVTQALIEAGGEGFITADHGNVELMQDPNTGQPHTAHTSGPVPLIYVGHRNLQLLGDGSLSDIVPSLLHLMAIEQPSEMTGHSIIEDLSHKSE